jgi:hypothetical protein
MRCFYGSVLVETAHSLSAAPHRNKVTSITSTRRA